MLNDRRSSWSCGEFQISWIFASPRLPIFIFRKHGQNVTSEFVWIVNIPTQGSVQKYRFGSGLDEEDIMTKAQTDAFVPRLPHDVVVFVAE